jgi:hypothetical protein
VEPQARRAIHPREEVLTILEGLSPSRAGAGAAELPGKGPIHFWGPDPSLKLSLAQLCYNPDIISLCRCLCRLTRFVKQSGHCPWPHRTESSSHAEGHWALKSL